jgi:hypothetical protein
MTACFHDVSFRKFLRSKKVAPPLLPFTYQADSAALIDVNSTNYRCILRLQCLNDCNGWKALSDNGKRWGFWRTEDRLRSCHV